MSPEITLNTMFERAAAFAGRGLRFCGSDDARFFDWAEIHHRATGTAGALQRLGICRGDRVALVLPTGVEFFDGLFGVLLAGAVPVPLYPPVRLGRLDEYHARTAVMIRAVGARLVLSDGRVSRILGRTVRAARPELGCLRVDELQEAGYQRVEVREDDLGLVQFSSGTTVEPKAVALSHRALVAQTRALNAFWPDTAECRHSGVSWLPLYHDMGLVGCVFPALERPGTLTLIPPEVFVARPATWLRTISEYRATISPAPNFAYALCVDKVGDGEIEGIDLSCWMVALSGAEAVAPDVLRAFQDRFERFGFSSAALTPVYGLSEAALAVSFSAVDESFTSRRFDRNKLAEDRRAVPQDDGLELVSVGTPIPGFSVRVVGEDGAEIPEGEIGMVLVAGPSLMDGYLDHPELTREVLDQGWLNTGDLGFIDGGELFLAGRAKDVLILRGRNHAPEEVELALTDVEGIRSGCVVAASHLPERASGEQLYVFVEAARDVGEDRYPEIAESSSKKVLAATGLRVDMCVVLEPGTLPRTSSGKLRRQASLRQWLRGELTAPKPVTGLRIAGAAAQSAVAFARFRWERRDGR